MTRPQPATAPPVISGYELRELLGQGAMGTVWRALETSTRREVAVKWLARQADETRRQRFVREAHAIARLKHPFIVPLYSAGTTDRGAYLVMELVDGFPLAAAIEKRGLARDVLVDVIAKVARALEAAHAAGVVHRDVKPSNVVIDAAGEPRLLDFGLARLLDVESNLTAPASLVGTVLYMSPEQASGNAAEAGPASDVFSLGAILYEALSGKPPFYGANALEVAVKISQARIEPLPETIPPALARPCLAALARDPASRPTAAALASELEAFLAARPSRVNLALVVLAAAFPLAAAALALATPRRADRPAPPTVLAEPAPVASPLVAHVASSSLAPPAPPVPPPAAPPVPAQPPLAESVSGLKRQCIDAMKEHGYARLDAAAAKGIALATADAQRPFEFARYRAWGKIRSGHPAEGQTILAAADAEVWPTMFYSLCAAALANDDATFKDRLRELARHQKKTGKIEPVVQAARAIASAREGRPPSAAALAEIHLDSTTLWGASPETQELFIFTVAELSR